MIWINLAAAILISSYAQWIFYRSRRFARDLSHAGDAGDVLKNVLDQRRFYSIQCIGGLAALALFLGVKTLLLIFKLPEPMAFTAFIFGNFAHRLLIIKFGCLGVGLTVIVATCFYQWLRSKHYFDVLYALRDPLQLGPDFHLSSHEPSAPPAAGRPVV
jgi:hypothetical protein